MRVLGKVTPIGEFASVVRQKQKFDPSPLEGLDGELQRVEQFRKVTLAGTEREARTGLFIIPSHVAALTTIN